MNKVFLVTSSIELREDKPFECYRWLKGHRSVFSAEQRLNQTKQTIEAIRKDHSDRIIIMDTSDTSYKIELERYPGVEYFHVKDIYDTSTYDIITTHYHKCICEATLLNTFTTMFEKELREYDFIVKVTGRYQPGNISNVVFTRANRDKLFFKKPYPLNPNDLAYDRLFTAETKRAGIIPHDYDQALYGFGIDKLDFVKDIYNQTITRLQPRHMRFIDIEKIMYLLTRPHTSDIIEVDWTLIGYDGMSGDPISR